jgi:universal stress protein E
MISENRFKKIMLVTTESVDTQAAEQTAIRLAKRSGASIILVDSVRTPFHLPSESVSTDRIVEVAMKVKQDYLESIAGQCRVHGVEVESTVLMSARTSEEIVGLVLATECDLVIRYFKGEHSRVPSRLGQTARNLMRVCPVPLLLVGEKVIDNPNVLACINAEHGLEENQSILDATYRVARSNDKISAIYCWDIDVSAYVAEESDERVYALLPEETREIFEQIRVDLNEQYDLSRFGDRVRIESGDPIKLIPQRCFEHSIDVAVMSSASLHHPLGRLMGSTIEGLVEQLPCALLVVKPIGFQSPVAPAEVLASGSIDVE